MKSISNYYVDNRDIRDNNYLGPLINFYDETNHRHRNVVGKISEKEALETIEAILLNDVKPLEDRISNYKRYLNEKNNANPELTFKAFYSNIFYELVYSFIRNGFKFELEGYFKPLTIKDVKDIQKLQHYELYGEFSFFSVNRYVSLSERTFCSMYNRYKGELKWFWDKDPIQWFKYNSLQSLEEALNNCKKRINEVKELKSQAV